MLLSLVIKTIKKPYKFSSSFEIGTKGLETMKPTQTRSVLNKARGRELAWEMPYDEGRAG